MKKIICLLMLSYCSVPDMAHSFSLVPKGCCGKYCAMGTGPMADPAEVDQAMSQFDTASKLKIDQEISNIEDKFWEVWGKGLSLEINKNRETDSILTEDQNVQFHDLIVEFGVAQQEMYKQRAFGPTSRMDSLTKGIDFGGQFQVGTKTETRLKQKLSTSFTDYEDRWTNIADIQQHHIEKTISIESVAPTSGTFDPQQLKDAQGYTELILEPIPEIQISEIQKETKSGAEYEFVRQIKKANLIVPQLVHNENIANHSPSLPMGSLATKIYRSMGGVGAPPPVHGEQISSSAMLDLMVDSRFANPNWYAELGEKNKHAIMRDWLMSKALALEEQKRQLKETQLLALLLAQKTAGKTNKYYRLLQDELYKQTITADVAQ